MYLIALLFLISTAGGEQHDNPEYCNFRKLARILKLGISQKEVEDLVKMNCKVINFGAEMKVPEYCTNRNQEEMVNLGIPLDAIQHLFDTQCKLTDTKSSASTPCEFCQDSYKELVKMAKSGSSNAAIKSFIYSRCAGGANSEKCRRTLMNVSWNVDEGTDDRDSLKICREVGFCGKETKNPEHCKFARLSQMIKHGISVTDIEALLHRTCNEIIFKEDTIKPGYCTSRSLDEMEPFGVSRSHIKEVYKATCTPTNVEFEDRTLCAVCKEAHQKLLDMTKSAEQDEFIDKACKKFSGNETAKCRSGLQYIAMLLRIKRMPNEAEKLCGNCSEGYPDDDDEIVRYRTINETESATQNPGWSLGWYPKDLRGNVVRTAVKRTGKLRKCGICRANTEKLKEMVQAGLPVSSIEDFIRSSCIIAHWKEQNEIDSCRSVMQEVYRYLSLHKPDDTQSLCQKANLCSEHQGEYE